MTAGTNHAATTSASRWIGARLRCASPTIRTIWASSVSLPTRSARMTSPPVPLMVPPVTGSPAFFSTGTGSPVIIDSSTELDPSTTMPSTGIFSPGRTRSRSPAIDLLERHVRLGSIARDATRGLGSKSEQGADRTSGAAARAQFEDLAEQDQDGDDARRLEVDGRPSPWWPRKESGKNCGKSVATTLNEYAAPVPMPINVNMLRLRFTNDAHIRSKKGAPAQSTTGVASAISSHPCTSGDIRF